MVGLHHGSEVLLGLYFFQTCRSLKTSYLDFGRGTALGLRTGTGSVTRRYVTHMVNLSFGHLHRPGNSWWTAAAAP